MGFTRHERLDVKKPGPLPPQPPSDQPIPPKVSNPKNLEVLPEHLRNDVPAKKKKVAVDQVEEEEVPFSVDTQYAHVILKNPLDNWKDGARIVQALGEMLNLQSYFTHPRVDRHEVSFRVEPNPEKKTASDVAKSINDSRFKNNLSRRLGVLVSRAGVGDKIKDSDLNSILSTKPFDSEIRCTIKLPVPTNPFLNYSLVSYGARVFPIKYYYVVVVPPLIC